jgi:hypothetical protein
MKTMVHRARQSVLWLLALSPEICVPAQATGDENAHSAQATRDAQDGFRRALQADWRATFHDPCTADWQAQWFPDGQRATVKNTPRGMELTAGPEFKNDAHHMVLWTKRAFAGDLKIDYEYTRLDAETRCVNILYVQLRDMYTRSARYRDFRVAVPAAALD